MNNRELKDIHYLSAEEFYDEVKKRMKELVPGEKQMFLATLDFDHFNYINDLFGYETGDLLLEKVTEHFSGQLCEKEIFSRIHADLFVFCLDIPDDSKIYENFEKMTDLDAVIENVFPTHYSIVASGGIVAVTDDTVSLPALLDCAHYARKKAKGNMRSSYRFYDEKMKETVNWQKMVTISMEAALKNREFEMYLQPKVLIKSDRIVGAEALVRWNSKDNGIIYPDQFISIMEQSGFIRQLDFFMLEEACSFLIKSESMGISQIPISVNFSKAHLSADYLVEKIYETVNRMGVSTNLIEIEFTESISTADFQKLTEIITGLKRLGFGVSLDDFGNAYSSLSCLKDLPIDIIKIDKGFLSSSTDTDKGKIVITKVIELIKSLNMSSVMEGVETQEQVDFLEQLSCDLGQGYFYAKPMPVEEFVEYLRQGSVLSDLSMDLTDQIGSVLKPKVLK